MEPNYIVLIALCVVISEAKLFIGDCSYGFCEQNCKQIKEFEMECFCKRGFAIKPDGRKCIKSAFVTDDELSSGYAESSGDTGNCDNEDGNCDTVGTEIVISGDGDDMGSGAGASVIEQIFSTTSSIRAKYANTSFTLPTQLKTVHTISRSKTMVLKTVERVTPTAIITRASTSVEKTRIDSIQKTSKVGVVAGEKTKHATKTTISELKPIKTHVDKKEISTSIKTIVHISKSKGVIGIFKSSVVIPSRKSSTPSIISTITVAKPIDVKPVPEVRSSSIKHAKKIIVQTKLVEDTSTSVRASTSKPKVVPTFVKPDAPTSTTELRKATSIHIAVKPPLTHAPEKAISSTSSISRLKTVIELTDKKSVAEEKVVSVYKHTSIVVAPTSVLPTKTDFTEIKKVVIQDKEDEVAEYLPKYNKSSSSRSVVLIHSKKPIASSKSKKPIASSKSKKPVTSSKSKKPVTPSKSKKPVKLSSWIPKKFIPKNTSSVIHRVSPPTGLVQTATIKSGDKIVPISVAASKSSTQIIKASVHKTDVDKSTTTIRNITKIPIHKLKKMVKESISTTAPKTSFHIVSASPPIIEKTTPLNVIRTDTVKTSSFSQKTSRQPSSTTQKLVGRTAVSTKVKDIPSTSSVTSDDKSKSFIVIFDGRKSSSKLPTKDTTTKISDEIEITESSPTKGVTDIHVVVVVAKTESRGCTLLVNKYILVAATIFTIYFLRVL